MPGDVAEPPETAGPRRRCYRAAIALIILAPLVAEILPGSAPLSKPSLVPFLLLIYGPGALLIREVVRAGGRGWAAILLLGAAYGVIEEGLALQSLFNPSLYNAAQWGGRFLGINGVYAETAVVIHAVWSAAIPILIADLLFPRVRDVPYLGWFGRIVVAFWYLIGVLLLGLLARFLIAPNYRAPGALLILSACAAILLVLAAFLTRRASRSPPAHELPTSPRVWFVFLAVLIGGIIWHLLLAVLWRFQPRFATWPLVLLPMLGAIVTLAAVLWLIHRWSASRGWDDRHRFAVAAGALLAHSLIGVMIFARRPLDRLCIATLLILLLLVVAARVGRTCRAREAA